MSERLTSQTVVRLSDEMHDALRQLSDEWERSVAQLVRMAIRTLLATADGGYGHCQHCGWALTFDNDMNNPPRRHRIANPECQTEDIIR